MAEWQRVPADMKYWHPANAGFNGSNAKFICSQCQAEFPLSSCIDCGATDSWLGTSMTLPGVFCEACGMGGYVWQCPKCEHRDKMFLVFWFDASRIHIRKKRFWEYRVRRRHYEELGRKAAEWNEAEFGRSKESSRTTQD